MFCKNFIIRVEKSVIYAIAFIKSDEHFIITQLIGEN